MFLKMTGFPILVSTSATMTPNSAAKIGSRLRVAAGMSELQPQETHLKRERFLGVGVKSLLGLIDELKISHRIRLFQARRNFLTRTREIRKRQILIRVVRSEQPNIAQPPMQNSE